MYPSTKQPCEKQSNRKYEREKYGPSTTRSARHYTPFLRLATPAPFAHHLTPPLHTRFAPRSAHRFAALDSTGKAVCDESSSGPIIIHYCPGFSLGSCVVEMKDDSIVFSGNAVPMTSRLDEGGVLSEMKSVRRAMESLEELKVR